MTVDQQLRDRFDRVTDGSIPEPDLAAAIAGGRRRRRRRTASYAVGSLAVAAIAASALVAPQLGGGRGPTVAAEVADDGTFVPGTTIDTDLAAAVAAADPSLPAPRDVYASDWSRDTPLPDADFANATEWQLVYDLSPNVELLVYVTKPIPGVAPDAGCLAVDGNQVVRPSDGTTTVDVPSSSCTEWEVGAGHMQSRDQKVGEPGSERYWYLTGYTDLDGRFVNVIEKVRAADWTAADGLSVLPRDSAMAIAAASGLDFPDPVTPPPAP